jgi:hypothetical protein
LEKISTVRRRRSKPLNPSTLVGGGSVNVPLQNAVIKEEFNKDGSLKSSKTYENGVEIKG